MKRFTVTYTFRKDKRKKTNETREAECVQWSDGSIYMNGDLYPGDFSNLQEFEKEMRKHYDSYEICWIDQTKEVNM